MILKAGRYSGVKNLINNTFINCNENHFGESLPEQIAKYILKKIMKGELVSGNKIFEEYVASELNTSRAPVREALYLLQIDNIVGRIPIRGTVVKNFTDFEVREYTEVMVGLIQMALDSSNYPLRSKKKTDRSKTLAIRSHFDLYSLMLLFTYFLSPKNELPIVLIIQKRLLKYHIVFRFYH